MKNIRTFQEFLAEGSVSERLLSTNEARSWGTYSNKEGAKVNSVLDKEFDKFVSALEKANTDWQNAVKQFTTGTSTGIGAKSGIQDSDGKYAVSNYVESALKKVFGLNKFGEYSVQWMFESVNEAWFGPFQFNDKMSDEELKKMYDDAVSGYANWQRGFQYPKSDYKKAYQEIEKILKKRGVKVDEENETQHTFERFLNEAKDYEKTGRFVNQEDIRAARGVVTGLTPGKYKLAQDVVAWVVDMKDQEESTTWIGKSNIPRVKLNKVKLKKGTSLERNAFGEEVYLEGNKDNPIWLIDPTIFAARGPRNPKDAHYEELRKIAKIIEK